MKKVSVLWIDHDIENFQKSFTKLRYHEYYPDTSIQFANSLRELRRLAEDGVLCLFDVVVSHMSFEGLSDFIYRNRQEMYWSRLGIVTDAIIDEELTHDVMRHFSPDFLSDYSDTEFINWQMKKGAISLPEIEWRGKKVLTSIAKFDQEGRLVSRERE